MVPKDNGVHQVSVLKVVLVLLINSSLKSLEECAYPTGDDTSYLSNDKLPLVIHPVEKYG